MIRTIGGVSLIGLLVGRRLGLDRQIDMKCRSGRVTSTKGPDTPAASLDQGPRDPQSETRSGNCAGVTGAAVEAFKNSLGLAMRQPLTLVGHLESDRTAALCSADGDRRAGRGVFCRILDYL